MCAKDFGNVFFILGIVNVICAVVSISMQAGATTLVLRFNSWNIISGVVSAGAWCGVFFWAIGVICIVLGRRLRDPYTSSRNHKGLLGAVLGMSITSILFCLTLIVMGSISTQELVWGNFYCLRQDSLTFSYRSTRPPYRNCFNGSYAMGIILIVVGAVQLASSITLIVYSSRLLCCRKSDSNPDGVRVVYVNQPTSGMPQQIVHGAPTTVIQSPVSPTTQFFVAGQPLAAPVVPTRVQPPSYIRENQNVPEPPEIGGGRYAKLKAMNSNS